MSLGLVIGCHVIETAQRLMELKLGEKVEDWDVYGMSERKGKVIETAGY